MGFRATFEFFLIFFNTAEVENSLFNIEERAQQKMTGEQRDRDAQRPREHAVEP
jgi:hypothetical protein